MDNKHYGAINYSSSEDFDCYNPTGSNVSTSSSGSSSYNPNIVVYSSKSSDEEGSTLGKNIYSLEGDGHIQFNSEAEQENSWSDLFINGLKNIEDSDMSKDITSWNDIFQKILDLPDSTEKSKKLSTIANDFVYAANTFGKIIISELTVPQNLKTIKSIEIGGVAGGQKFVIQDILFKFATDTEIVGGVWMYGDDKRADYFAQKSANHEIKGLNHFMEISNGGLIRFPLMAIIDYRGYRLLAISQLPINHQTIVYGSCDAGKTVHNSDPLIFAEMERISKILNLRGHTVGLTQTFLYGPGDIEVHKGKDGRYYMIDFARIFPPEYPLVVQNHKDTIGREIFYSMLRPELVKKVPAPLSSDAFSGWQTSLFEGDLNRDVIRATKYLHSEVIEAAVAVINGKEESDYSPSTHKVYEIIEIINILRSLGINSRYFGVISSRTTVKSIKELLLSEVVARVWKRIIRSKLRRIMDILMRPTEESYKHLIADAFALILKPQETDFWSNMERGSFKYIALQVFPRCLSESDMNPKFDLRSVMDVKLVILRLNKMLNIKLNPSSITQFIEENDYCLGFQDIIEIGSTVKYPYIIDFSHGSELLHQTQQVVKTANPNPLEVERWIDNTKETLYEAVRQMPSSFKVVLKLLTTLLIKVSVTTDILKATRVLIIGIIMGGWNVTKEERNIPSLCGLLGLYHLHLATIYLFHSDFVERFHSELNDAKEYLEIALKQDPDCLNEYIYQVLPMSGVLIPSILDKHSESYQKRKVYQLLTLNYLLSQSDKDSILHQHLEKYMIKVIQVDNFEILHNAESMINCQVLTQFFKNSQLLQSLSVRKLTMTPLISRSISHLPCLTTLGLSDVTFTESSSATPLDRNLNSFFKMLFENCKSLHTLNIIANKNVNDETFNDCYHYFSNLKTLTISKTPLITDITLVNILPYIKSNLKSLTLSNNKEFTDSVICMVLEAAKELVYLNLDHLSLTTDQTAYCILDYQLNLESLSLLNSNYSKDCIEKVSKELSPYLNSFIKPDFKVPHTYKIV